MHGITKYDSCLTSQYICYVKTKVQQHDARKTSSSESFGSTWIPIPAAHTSSVLLDSLLISPEVQILSLWSENK